MNKPGKQISEVAIYQARNGQIEFKGDFEHDTVWGNLNQIAELFGRDKSVISRHIKNIFNSCELKKTATVAKIATVQKEGKREITREIDYYNLDMILSVGYRVDSNQATQFRIWATTILKQHLVDGYTINKRRIATNHDQFMQAVSDVQSLLPAPGRMNAQDALELIKAFADTWTSLDAYDTQRFPKQGITRKKAIFVAADLAGALDKLKQQLVSRKETTDLFGKERIPNAVNSIIGNVFQSFDGQDLYSTVEEKSAHLLYFIVKDHPFMDGNKRSGAFSFVWFLRKTGMLRASLTPEALTTLTLLVAESNPKEKDKIIGLILLLLRKQK